MDLLVVNEVGGGKVFGRPENEAVILDAAGAGPVPPGPSRRSPSSCGTGSRLAGAQSEPTGARDVPIRQAVELGGPRLGRCGRGPVHLSCRGYGG